MIHERPEVAWLGHPVTLDVSYAGGKGAALAAMTSWGYTVPAGFVVAASALEHRVDAPRLRELVRSGDHEAAMTVVRAAEPPHAAALAYEQLGGAVAVRSSARAEDSAAASFAGRHDTYLNVEGTGAVMSCIAECWASFFSPRALSYRARQGLVDDLGIGVVVQAMVEPTTSGVLFTVDPAGGRRDRMIVEAVLGPLDALVSGRAAPARYVIARDGTVEEPACDPLLGEPVLRRLAKLGCDLEGRLGGPQDVEWALAGDRLHVLQSRAVTTS